jgi:hypothetical protein
MKCGQMTERPVDHKNGGIIIRPIQYQSYNNFAFNKKGNMLANDNVGAVCTITLLIILFHGDLIVNPFIFKLRIFICRHFVVAPVLLIVSSTVRDG